MRQFKSYNNKLQELIPKSIEERIPEDDPVRLVDTLVDEADIRPLEELYSTRGPRDYHPRMMLKVVIYAYMNNILSCRGIEHAMKRDINFIWLAADQQVNYVTINRFRNKTVSFVEELFTQLVVKLAELGLLSLEEAYVDGTKIHSKANKYTMVWKKSVLRHKNNLLDKIGVFRQQIREELAEETAELEKEGVINSEKKDENPGSNEPKEEKHEPTPEEIAQDIDHLQQAIDQTPEPTTKEEKAKKRQLKKLHKELNECADKLRTYNNQLEIMGSRMSMSKTDPDATFMQMKEDGRIRTVPKPGYNVQISTQSQYITNFDLYPNPADTLTFPSFIQSLEERYGHRPSVVIADAGYGSEENYRLLKEAGITGYVKYAGFHKEHRPRYKPSPYKPESLEYNAEEDYYTCPQGQRLIRTDTRHDTTGSGYVTESAVYASQNCKDCPVREKCYKGKANQRSFAVNYRLNEYKKEAEQLLLSKEGLKYRGRRCVEPEAVFGQIKGNMGYRRFRHFGMDKVKMDFAYVALAYNLKHLASDLLKRLQEGGGGTLKTLISLLKELKRSGKGSIKVLIALLSQSLGSRNQFPRRNCLILAA